MAHDPVLLENTRAWFVKAGNDLRGAEIDLAAVPPLVEDVMFHAQQAAEKALKGFLTWHDRPFGKTHDLREIGGPCAQIDSTLESVIRRAEYLTDYAWEFRYPGALPAPSIAEAEEALSLAREVVHVVLNRLPAEVRP